jgi:imidazolonepropionase-like amidohydrolase
VTPRQSALSASRPESRRQFLPFWCLAMRLLRVLLCFLLAVPAIADTVVFRNVSVVSMTSPKVLENQNVIIRDGRIESISAIAKAPKGATVIDGTGRFLMPGLADMHAHVPAVDAKAGLMLDTLTMFIANGVTTVRGMWGLPGQLEVREKAKTGQIVSPSLFLAGPAFNNETIASADEAAARVREQKKQGWDLLKIHDGLTLAEYDAIAKTAKEVGMRFGGHVPMDVTLPHALEMRQETIEHMDPYAIYLETAKGPVDEKKLADLVKRLKDAGAWVVPTNAVSEITFGSTPLETLKEYPENKYSPNAAVDVWVKMYEQRSDQIPRAQAANVVANNRRIIRAFRDAGVKMLLGTDTLHQFVEPGFSVMREMVSLRNAGLTPYEVLRTATVLPAEYLGRQTTTGTIEPGKRADVVLLDANPLENVANVARIRGVMANGHWYSRADLDKALQRIIQKYH